MVLERDSAGLLVDDVLWRYDLHRTSSSILVRQVSHVQSETMCQKMVLERGPAGLLVGDVFV